MPPIFRRWLSDMPIRQKLSLINLSLVLIAMAPVIGITLSYEFVALQRTAVERAELRAESLRSSIASATASLDAAAAQSILQTALASSDVSQAAVFLPERSVLAGYVRTADLTPIASPVERDYSDVNADRIHVERSVRHAGHVVGRLVIDADQSSFWRNLVQYLLVNLAATLVGFALVIPASWALRRCITSPLADLVSRTSQQARTSPSCHPGMSSTSGDEIAQLSAAFDGMIDGQRERDRPLAHMTYYDTVTGLPNRHYFMEKLERAIAAAGRYGNRCCLMIVDLNEFGAFNDTHGRAAGDLLLRAVAQRLRHAARDSDFVSRIGSDEFAILLDGIRDPAGGGVLAAKILAALTPPVSISHIPLSISANIGIAICPDDAGEMAALLRIADEALDLARMAGKNRFAYRTA